MKQTFRFVSAGLVGGWLVVFVLSVACRSAAVAEGELDAALAAPEVQRDGPEQLGGSEGRADPAPFAPAAVDGGEVEGGEQGQPPSATQGETGTASSAAPVDLAALCGKGVQGRQGDALGDPALGEASDEARASASQRSPWSDADVARIEALQPLVRAAAAEHGVSTDLLNAMIWVESRFIARARSGKNLGLMQLGPSVSKAMAKRLGTASRPTDPRFAVRAGALHLATLIRRYEGAETWAVLAYNRGVGGVAKIFDPDDDRAARESSYVRAVERARAAFADSRWSARCVTPP